MRGDFEAIHNVVRREVQKVMAMYKFTSAGEVDSWDPDKHVAKIKLKPSGTITGWLPVGGGIGAGKGRGFAHGLTKGDQVAVTFYDGSLLNGIITHRFWSDKDKPLKDVKSGEDHWVGKHKQWAKMLDKDKSLVLRGYPGNDDEEEKEENDKAAYQIFDKDGNIIRTIKKGDLKGEIKKGNYSMDVQTGSYEVKHKGNATFKPQGGSKVQVGEGTLLRVMLEDGTPSQVLWAKKG
jgi:hypothetical protein